MSLNSKCRWYQFSLRMLLLLVTVVGILIGSRLSYLRWQADFHAAEADRLAHKKRAVERDYFVWNPQEWLAYAHHRRLANEYRTALCRPWRSVDTQMEQTEIPLDLYFLSREGTP